MTTESRAQALYSRVRGCTLCALAKTRTLAVPGEGPLDAEVMCIGEAPGVNEDKQGRPFVGAAGQFLEELLAAAGLKREEVYICNVLKCRPPANRDPLPTEIELCRDYLDEQIDLVDPLVLITLGRFSMAKFFPNQTISRIHGQARLSAGRYYMPMYHPAAALHQANLRGTLLADFAKVPDLLERARALQSPPRASEPEPQPSTTAQAERPVAESAAHSAQPDAPDPGRRTDPEPAAPQINQMRLFE